MKKIGLIVIAHFVMGIIFFGCCTNPDKVKIIGVSQFFMEHDSIFGNPSDTIRGDFTVINSFDTEIAHSNFNIGFNNLYAMQPCEDVFINEIESIEWYFDVPLILNGETIPPNTNLVTHNGTKDLLEYNQWRYQYYIAFTIGNLQFPTGYTTIKLILKTDDNIDIENEIEVYMAIE